MRHVSLSAAVLVGIFVGWLGFVPGAAIAQEATPAVCPDTTPEENTILVTDLYAAVAADEDVASFLADEHTVHLPAGRDEVNEIADWATQYQEDFADLTITVELVIAQDDLVAIYSTWSGTQRDDNEERGFPVTGGEAEWVQSTFFRIACGKIVEVWPLADLLGQLTDLGIITEAEWQSAEGMATPTP
jgi:predicted ester cyclase